MIYKQFDCVFDMRIDFKRISYFTFENTTNDTEYRIWYLLNIQIKNVGIAGLLVENLTLFQMT